MKRYILYIYFVCWLTIHKNGNINTKGTINVARAVMCYSWAFPSD